MFVWGSASLPTVPLPFPSLPPSNSYPLSFIPPNPVTSFPPSLSLPEKWRARGSSPGKFLKFYIVVGDR